MLLANKEGIVVTGPIVNLVAAAAANAVVIFTIPILANQLVGVKSVKIRKVRLFNYAAGNDTVEIGNGVAGAFVALLPPLNTMNGLGDAYTEEELPEVESFADITAFPVLLAAGNIDIQLEVLVIG